MNLDIDAIRGDTLTIQFEIESNIELDLNDDEFEIAFSVKQPATSTGYVLQKDKTAVSKIGNNIFLLRVAPEDTTYLVPGFYNYDLQITIYDDIFTIAIGRLQLILDITRPRVNLPAFPYPDIDADGIITTHDAEMIATAYRNIMTDQPSGLTPAQENLADCNRDGYIDMTDSSLVRAYIEQCQQGVYQNDAYGWASFMTDRFIPQG